MAANRGLKSISRQTLATQLRISLTGTREHWEQMPQVSLVGSRAGRAASDEHSIPPFVDGSRRREPDLEHAFPSISCLCRAGKFAPRLEVGDVVVYLTRKARYGDLPVPHRRLTAVLRVFTVLPTHAAAAEWYRARKLPLPSNCMVPGNAAKPLGESHRIFRSSRCLGEGQTWRAWDAAYRARAKQHKTFVMCEPLFRELSWNAPVVTDEKLVDTMGSVPATQNPGAMTMDGLRAFVEAIGLNLDVRAK
jgi:hypothetical protein